MTALMYRWPKAAEFGRVVPKTKFYEHTVLGQNVKDSFVSDVRRIAWAYKIAASTINLPGTVEVPEIQVFEIAAKEDDVAEVVLAAIDNAVRTPIIFEIARGEGVDRTVRMVAAHKQLGTPAPNVGPYFSTAWQSAWSSRVPLPTAIDLTSLYMQLLQPLTPVESRAADTVSDMVSRLKNVRLIEREIDALERSLRNEPQLNRKVKLRRTLRSKQAILVDLTGPTDGPVAGNTN